MPGTSRRQLTAPPSPLPLDIAAIEAGLAALALGHPLVYLPSVDSTNTAAQELARAGTPDGTVVLAEVQMAGRGRLGRAWKSLPGQQLALSIVLHPRVPPHFLVMASALSVAGAIETVTALRPGIKWPNDVLLDGRKLCGILIETSADYAIVGIGLNINGSVAGEPTLAGRAITLAEVLGHEVSREALALDVLRRLGDHYTRLNADPHAQADLREQWRDQLVTLGHEVTIAQGTQRVTGIAEDVDASGALLVRATDGSAHTIVWGDVE